MLKLIAVAIVAVLSAGCAASLSDTTQAVVPLADRESALIKGQSKRATGVAASLGRLPAETKAQLDAVTPGSSGYKIGNLDLIEVVVFKVADLNRVVQVGENGLVTLPLVGEVSAAGRTAQEIEKEVARKLGDKYLQNPQVSVLVKEYNSQRVTLDGAVKKPGIYALKGPTTLMSALALAEGISNEVASNDVTIFRTTNAGRTVARYDIEAIKIGGAKDPEVMPGDMIVIAHSASKQAFNNFVKIIPLFNVFVPLL